ncbi:hypothetical protein JMJ56_29355 [Belnapia sp. T18]|uniref:Uncharacterized protein n=1 Tax=Belnapia arida TaxID=2804533 RepID=A0ABS1UBM5_9PROT|nr:hypothetical protein [Belnapia arida]MBL6082088.1 hypothetical protein [Belnapia arida]
MNKAQTHDELAAATGCSSSTYDKIGASLEATPWRMSGGQGGGGNTRHSPAPYLTGLTFGSGANHPKDGHLVAKAAARCGYIGSALFLEAMGPGGIVIRSAPQQVDVPELRLGDKLFDYGQARIEFYAGEAADAPQTLIGKPLDIGRSLIRLDFDPFAAQVEWRSEPTDEGNLLLVHYFQQEEELAKRRHMDPKAAAREMARIRRSSILPASMIFVAARILADGWAKSGKRLPGSGQEEALAGASSDSERPANEKTPGFAEPGASRHSNQSREPRETGPNYPRPDSKRACVKSQAHAGSRGRQTPEPRRHGARSEDPPSFGLFAAGHS